MNLCHFFSQILFYFNTILSSHFEGQHKVGILNVETDGLFRTQYHPT